MRKSINPNYLGNISLNQCRKITIKELQKEAKKHIPDIMKNLSQGIELEHTQCKFGGNRYWFKCIRCGRRCFTLYEHPVTLEQICRKCLGIGYAKQRYKGMIEETLFK